MLHCLRVDGRSCIKTIPVTRALPFLGLSAQDGILGIRDWIDIIELISYTCVMIVI